MLSQIQILHHENKELSGILNKNYHYCHFAACIPEHGQKCLNVCYLYFWPKNTGLSKRTVYCQEIHAQINNTHLDL